MEWLNSLAKDASASAVKTSIEKLTWFRNIDAHLLDLSMLPNERRRFLATVARRSTNQGLERRGDRKFPILLAFVAQAVVDQLDEVVALFDQAVSARESRAKSRTDEALAERAKKGEVRQLLMDVILPVPGRSFDPGRGGRRHLAEPGRDADAAGTERRHLDAAAQGPRPAVGAGLLLHLPAAVHPERADGDRL
ncbi:hypothetical protein [Actinoallomurus iriomotensis]|uniref:hypothetical protein n=1 Tax=Actinoallomurus iriomotensis TaxID=478107 RepID=UPI0025555CB7|nr:hypothetical protein [Actinoallomurus iriomotensis]